MPLLVDLACVLVFVLLGRRAHDEGSFLLGTLSTAWPFLVGALAGWAVLRAAGLPRTALRSGAVVAAGVVTVGMLLRALVQEDGTPVSFVVVASVVNTVLLVGWRAAVGVRRRHRRGQREGAAASSASTAST